MITQPTLESFCQSIFAAVGFAEDDAQIVAEIIVECEMRGIASHATRLIPALVRHVHGGGVDPQAKLEVLDEGSAWSMIDAHGALGHLAAYHAVHVAMKKARTSGVGLAGVRRGNHLGALGAYALMCARAGMICLITNNTNPVMAVSGSSEKSMGNNPFAFGAPAGNEPPIVLDMACSAAAGSKVVIASRNGAIIPVGWSINSAGDDTTDPLDYLERDGALLPMSGHKGYGLAVMVEVLAGVLTGASLTSDIKAWDKQTDQVADQGFNFIVLNVESFMPRSLYEQRIDGLITRVRSLQKKPGVDRIYLPGEIEHEHQQQARQEGITFQDWHLESLKEVALELGLDEQYDSMEAKL